MVKPKQQKFEEIAKSIRLEIDSYQETIWGLVGISHELRWNDSKKELRPASLFEFGRGMCTADGDKVTPDLVVQVDDSFGAIVEAKIGYNPDKDHKKPYDQLRKYDGTLNGWFLGTSKIKQHDLILLVHQTRLVTTCDEIKEIEKNGALNINNNFCVVGAARQTQGNEFLFLIKQYGGISDQKKDEKLRKGLPINMELLAVHYGAIKMYDYKPPLAFLMGLLWDDYFPSMSTLEEYLSPEGDNPRIVVDENSLATQIYEDMFQQEHLRNNHQSIIPKPKWVREALDAFVELGWASKRVDAKYEIEIKQRRQPLERFINFEVQKKVSQEDRQKRNREELPLLADQIQNGLELS